VVENVVENAREPGKNEADPSQHVARIRFRKWVVCGGRPGVVRRGTGSGRLGQVERLGAADGELQVVHHGVDADECCVLLLWQDIQFI
jgi:hypothetical protein